MKNLINEIQQIKLDKNIIIISSFITPLEIQEVSDYVGDFRGLYKSLKSEDKKMIFYVGPDYLANLLTISFPGKFFFKITNNIECSLLKNVSSIEINELIRNNPFSKIAAYYKNEPKILYKADYIFDDTNSLETISKIKEKQIILLSDYNIGYYISTNFKPENKNFTYNFIITHVFCNPLYNVKLNYLQIIKIKHPKAKIIIHPESNYHLHSLAHKILGYTKLYEYLLTAKDKSEFILIYPKNFIKKLKKDFPNLIFFKPDVNLKCFSINDFSLEDVKKEILKLNYRVILPEEYIFKINKKLKNIVI